MEEIKELMDVKIEGKIYEVPTYTKTIVEDMKGNLVALDTPEYSVDMYHSGFARPGRTRRFKRRVFF